MKTLVTGWAWFIGSHIVDNLMSKWNEVIVYDNFCTWKELFIRHHFNNSKFTLIRWDILDLDSLIKAMKWCDFIFHLAANADVKWWIKNTEIDFQQNIVWTKNVLEAIRINWIKKIAFSSSATVYGEPNIFPTPEDCQLIQTSLYWASKLSWEALIQAYCEYYWIQSRIFRFVSWIWERYSHWVIFDFMKKLYKNSDSLEILWDWNQKKSYLYVKDWVDWIFFAINNLNEKINIVNLGHTDYMNVLDLADIVINTMWLQNVEYKIQWWERGWIWDSPFVHLDITKLKNIWRTPKTSIKEWIENTVRYIMENQELLNRE